jgi:hypothetical protein
MGIDFLNMGVIRNRDDIISLRNESSVDRIVVETRRLKYRRLVPAAFRYAVFALRPRGQLLIRDNGADNPVSGPFEINFGLMRQWAFRLLSHDCRLVSIDETKRELLFERTRPLPSAEWAAGVVFSGAQSEVPILHACLEGLLAQPELASRPGRILVCGPPEGRLAVEGISGVRYLDQAPSVGSRFAIGAKKNQLAKALDAPRIAIMHARIVLGHLALQGVPRDFDFGTPDVRVVRQGRSEPYLSLCFSDAGELGRFPRAKPLTTRNLWGQDHLAIHQQGAPYIDGGVFFARRDAYLDCPLDETIAWGEAEDVEWCARAAQKGYLVDLFPGSPATSQTDKIGPRPAIPSFAARHLGNGLRAARHCWAAANHAVAMVSGRR